MPTFFGYSCRNSHVTYMYVIYIERHDCLNTKYYGLKVKIILLNVNTVEYVCPSRFHTVKWTSFHHKIEFPSPLKDDRSKKSPSYLLAYSILLLSKNIIIQIQIRNVTLSICGGRVTRGYVLKLLLFNKKGILK